MRRRYDFGPHRLVWDFGEYNAPGIYGLVEMSSFGRMIYADLFGYKFEGEAFDDLDVAEFFYHGSEQVRTNMDIVISPPDSLIQKITTEQIRVPEHVESGMRFQYDHTTGDITFIQKKARERMVPVISNEIPIAEPDATHEENLRIEHEGAVSPHRYSWTWFMIILVAGIGMFGGLVYAIVAHRPAWAAFISLGLVCDLILLFAVIAYYDDVKQEEQFSSMRHRHRS
jgi:hypothetical protein